MPEPENVINWVPTDKEESVSLTAQVEAVVNELDGLYRDIQDKLNSLVGCPNRPPLKAANRVMPGSSLPRLRWKLKDLRDGFQNVLNRLNET